MNERGNRKIDCGFFYTFVHRTSWFPLLNIFLMTATTGEGLFVGAKFEVKR